MDGIINVYKEAGFTSFDVVAKLRGILKQKKIGHTGTLDPEAEGVLPICIGKATKVCEYLTNKDKVYQAVLHLGITTDTYDSSGSIVKEQNAEITEEELRQLIAGFAGRQKQVPPMYSALKVNGRKLCELARQGIEVERKAREIEIFSIEICSIQMPLVTLRVHCSKGTYIRSLCHDIGEQAGCGGCMEKLLRIQAAGFLVRDTYRLHEIEAIVKGTDPAGRSLSEILLPVDRVLLEYPKAAAKSGMEKQLANGCQIPADKTLQAGAYTEGIYRLYDSMGKFVGLYRYEAKNRVFRPEKMFC